MAQVQRWGAWILGLLVLTGCGQAGPAVPLTAQPEIPVVAGVASDGPRSEFVAAHYDIAVDRTTLTAMVSPRREAQAQPPQNLRFDFDIDQFWQPTTFQITGVELFPDGDVELQYEHAHPFGAPDLEAPITGLNRADLGYTGRLVVMGNGKLRSFFSGAVVTNPGLVENADGYVQPRDLLALGSALPLANTFPYKLLVDESANNRVGQDNMGEPTGSYASAAGGWQRSNLGGTNIGWTGYDYLHGGQRCRNVLRLGAGQIGEGLISLSVAILIQYTDPRGMGGPTRRLPPETADVTQFAYRLPYAALDCSKVVTDGAEILLEDVADAETTFTMYVRDWDAAASEAATFDLSAQGDVSRIQAGAGGPPTMAVDFPDLMNATRSGTLTGSHSGLPADELEYTLTVLNERRPGNGTFWGCVEVVDPEAGHPDLSHYQFGVDPRTIAPDASRALERRTWQLVPLRIGTGKAPTILSVTPTGAVGDSFDEVEFTATVDGPFDSLRWMFPGLGLEQGEGSLGGDGNRVRIQPGRPGEHIGYVYALAGTTQSQLFPFSYRINHPFSTAFSTPVTIDALGNASGIDVAVVDGLVTAAVTDETTATLRYYRATTAVPAGPADWVITDVDTAAAKDLPKLAHVQGKPVIIYTSTIDRTRVAVCSAAEPTGAGDWTRFNLPPEVTDYSDLVVTGSRAMFAFRHNTTSMLTVARASALAPEGTDWTYLEPNGAAPLHSWPVMGETNESAVIAATLVDGELRMLRATSISPRLPENWASFTAAYPPSTGLQPLPYSVFITWPFQPTIGYYSVERADNRMLKTNFAFPQTPSDWRDTGITESLSSYRVNWMGPLGRRKGTTIRGVAGSFATTLRLSLVDEPQGEDDWYQFTVDGTTGSGNGGSQAVVVEDGDTHRLLVLIAGGAHGLRQSVMEKPWLAVDSF